MNPVTPPRPPRIQGAFTRISANYASGLMLALCCITCSQRTDQSPAGNDQQPRAESANSGRGVPIAEAARKINSLLDEIADTEKKLPHREFDPAALATALGNDPKDHFEWVRDHTWWVPYAGLLRGSRGVLLDRVGSSMDRAVLLGDLLRRAGNRVRVAHATLPERQAADLLGKMQVSHPRRPDTYKPDAGSAPILSEASALVSARAGPLLAAFRHGDAAERDRGGPSAIAALRDHWWVEYSAGGKWVALDLLSQTDQAIATATNLYDWAPDQENPPVPESEWHAVKLRVVVERYDGAATTEATVLEHVMRPAEVIGKPIALAHFPTPWPEVFPFSSSQPNAMGDAAVQVRQWVPMLTVGEDTVVQSGFSDDGNMITAPLNPKRDIAKTGGSGFMGGFDTALGGGEAPKSFMTAEWIEFEFHVPGAATRTIRRSLFDLLGPERRAAHASGFDAGTNDLLVKRYQALLGVSSILIQPCAFTRDFIAHLAMSRVLESRADVLRLSRERDPKVIQNIVSSIEARLDGWGPLARLAFARSLLSKQTADWFIDQPNVLIYSAGLPIVNADKVGLVEAIDVASNSVGVRRDPTLDAFQVRLNQGVVDTVAEQVALSGNLDKGENTATSFPLADSDPWLLIRARDVVAVRKLDWPGDSAARLADDVEAGYAAYVPRHAFEANGRMRWGWWRVDPVSGETIGVMDSGRHATQAEYTINENDRGSVKVLKQYYNKNSGRVTQLRNRFGQNGRAALNKEEWELMDTMRKIESLLGPPG